MRHFLLTLVALFSVAIQAQSFDFACEQDTPAQVNWGVRGRIYSSDAIGYDAIAFQSVAGGPYDSRYEIGRSRGGDNPASTSDHGWEFPGGDYYSNPGPNQLGWRFVDANGNLQAPPVGADFSINSENTIVDLRDVSNLTSHYYSKTTDAYILVLHNQRAILRTSAGVLMQFTYRGSDDSYVANLAGGNVIVKHNKDVISAPNVFGTPSYNMHNLNEVDNLVDAVNDGSRGRFTKDWRDRIVWDSGGWNTWSFWETGIAIRQNKITVYPHQQDRTHSHNNFQLLDFSTQPGTILVFDWSPDDNAYVHHNGLFSRVLIRKRGNSYEVSSIGGSHQFTLADQNTTYLIGGYGYENTEDDVNVFEMSEYIRRSIGRHYRGRTYSVYVHGGRWDGAGNYIRVYQSNEGLVNHYENPIATIAQTYSYAAGGARLMRFGLGGDAYVYMIHNEAGYRAGIVASSESTNIATDLLGYFDTGVDELGRVIPLYLD